MGFWRKGALAGSAAETPDERGRVFTWTRERRIWVHLSAFLFFSILIHGSGFYLFKVVYPSPVRVEPEPRGILVLEPSEPAVRSILQRISDRTIYLHPPSHQSETRFGIERDPIRFTPSFQKIEQDLLPPEAIHDLEGDIEPLEPPARTAEGAPGTGNHPANGFKLDPGLAHRAIAPWSILNDYLLPAPPLPLIRFSIEIAPGGEVKVTSVDASLPDGEKAEMVSVIESALRFVPASGIERGWIEIGGEG